MTSPADDLQARRDDAIQALSPVAAARGWSAALLDESGEDTAALFPDGVAGLLTAHHDWLDRRMIAAAGSMEGLRLSQRVRHLVASRLQDSAAEKDSIRRAMALSVHPRHAWLLTRLLARTVDRIWRAAGDRSADMNWYSKRAILSGVYSATRLYWLNDSSPESADSLAFLDRRLACVAWMGALKRRWSTREEPHT